MSSAAATSLICTPGRLLSFTAVALNFSPYFAIFRGPAFATTHLRAVSSRCQLNRGKLDVGQQPAVRRHVELYHDRLLLFSADKARRTPSASRRRSARSTHRSSGYPPEGCPPSDSEDCRRSAMRVSAPTRPPRGASPTESAALSSTSSSTRPRSAAHNSPRSRSSPPSPGHC